MPGFVCDRCQTTWDDGEARCPKCLRRTTVRTLGRESSETARLASGDQSQTETARRGTQLLVAVAANIACGIAVSLAWRTLARVELGPAAIFGSVVAGASWIGAVLAGSPSWIVFARRCAMAAALGVWAFVSGAFAIVGVGDLSLPFTVGITLVFFGGGIVGAFVWMRGREEPTKPPTGKWR